MSATATQEREVVCSNCGDGLGEYTSERPYDKVGRCCENLPAPWGRDQETGLYVVPRSAALGQRLRDGEIDEEDYDEADQEPSNVPRCAYCGGECFTLRYIETTHVSVSSCDPEPNDELIFFDSYNEYRNDSDGDGHCVECASCGRDVNLEWQWC